MANLCSCRWAGSVADPSWEFGKSPRKPKCGVKSCRLECDWNAAWVGKMQLLLDNISQPKDGCQSRVGVDCVASLDVWFARCFLSLYQGPLMVSECLDTLHDTCHVDIDMQPRTPWQIKPAACSLFTQTLIYWIVIFAWTSYAEANKHAIDKAQCDQTSQPWANPCHGDHGSILPHFWQATLAHPPSDVVSR